MKLCENAMIIVNRIDGIFFKCEECKNVKRMTNTQWERIVTTMVHFPEKFKPVICGSELK